ncbi:hypothetical protein PGAL8A_00266300 [Plasmodium gallinaceum]|uniref:Uncharacterized protein n=1 Tax=Plasmodium gallinaceum TaxID=5849 RepID=A0A1J1GSP2_PLAGA|nr:hypothetical protein PGAL8A_00266300 [Plasmodium gallinaceum]CRG95460.1 hypothetical protein PGAL8A_00266300 [Plasmodium gallinaceum]
MDKQLNNLFGNSNNPVMPNCQSYEMAMLIAVILAAFTVLLSLLPMFYQSSSLNRELKEINTWNKKLDESLHSKDGDGIETMGPEYLVNPEDELLYGRKNEIEDSDEEYEI